MKGLHLNCSHITGLLFLSIIFINLNTGERLFENSHLFKQNAYNMLDINKLPGDIVSVQFKGKETGQTDEHRTGHWS